MMDILSDDSIDVNDSSDVLDDISGPDLEIEEQASEIETETISDVNDVTDSQIDANDLSSEEIMPLEEDQGSEIEEIEDPLLDEIPNLEMESISETDDLSQDLSSVDSAELTDDSVTDSLEEIPTEVPAQNDNAGFFEDDSRSIEELAQPAQEIQSQEEMRQHVWDLVNDSSREHETFNSDFLDETNLIVEEFEQEESNRLNQIDTVQAEIFEEMQNEIDTPTSLDYSADMGEATTLEENNSELEPSEQPSSVTMENIPTSAALETSTESDTQPEGGYFGTIESPHMMSPEQDFIDSSETGEQFIDTEGENQSIFDENEEYEIGSGEKFGKDVGAIDEVNPVSQNAYDDTIELGDMTLDEKAMDIPLWTDSTLDTRMEQCIDTFSSDNWDTISMEGKEHSIQQLADVVTEGLQIQNPPEIVFYDEPGSTMGYSLEGEIGININHLDDPAEAADTIAHELRHHWQQEQALDPNSELGRAFQDNFDNYIHPEDDFEAYENQLIEADAREFAEQIRNRVP